MRQWQRFATSKTAHISFLGIVVEEENNLEEDHVPPRKHMHFSKKK